jgi:hypothetical protein
VTTRSVRSTNFLPVGRGMWLRLVVRNQCQINCVFTALGKANPYRVYDVANNTGWVSVGTDHDTAAFAVNTIATWWHRSENLCTRTHPG